MLGVAPQHGHPVQHPGLERQDTPVGEQHSCLGRGPARHLAILGPVHRLLVPWLVIEGPDFLKYREHAPYLGVQLRLLHQPGADRLGQFHAEGAFRSGHLQIQPGMGSVDGLRQSEPIGHDEALEAPLPADDVAQEARGVGHVRAVDAVVAGHQSQHSRHLDRVLEGKQVELAQGALIDLG